RAVSRLTGERRTEPRAAGGLENGIAGLVPHVALATAEPDRDRLRLGFDAGGFVGQIESLDEQPIWIDPALIQRRLHDLHVRPGAADIEIGLRPIADERSAG